MDNTKNPYDPEAVALAQAASAAIEPIRVKMAMMAANRNHGPARSRFSDAHNNLYVAQQAIAAAVGLLGPPPELVSAEKVQSAMDRAFTG